MYTRPTKRPDKPLGVAEVKKVLHKYFVEPEVYPNRCTSDSGLCMYSPSENAIGCAVGIFLTVEDAAFFDGRGGLSLTGLLADKQAQDILNVYFVGAETFTLLHDAQRIHDCCLDKDRARDQFRDLCK